MASGPPVNPTTGAIPREHHTVSDGDNQKDDFLSRRTPTIQQYAVWTNFDLL
jgi:hypothetical protein